MPKPIRLAMTIRHLNESGEVITIMENGEVIAIVHRYGHGQFYAKTLEFEPYATLY